MLSSGRWFVVWCIAVATVGACGCSPRPIVRSDSEEAMFGASALRIHPTFTQVKDWTGDNKPDGVEAVIELQDQFGEPTRAAGVVRFELYSFRAVDAERRGKQLVSPWSFDLRSRDAQVAHWNPVERGYTFQLPYKEVRADRTYVLIAQFDGKGGRLFDQLILESGKENGRERRAVRAPINGPGHSN